MKEVKIKDHISDYIKQEFLNEDDAVNFTTETPLVSSRILDSISTLDLVDYIERTYGIEFNHHEVDQDNLDTVQKILDFVKSKKQ